MQLCRDCNIPFIDHSKNINPHKHLNRSKLHFNITCNRIFVDNIKGTLMLIWKSPYMFIKKQYPTNFAFWTLRILELFPREVCKILKKVGYILMLFLNVCKLRMSERVKGVSPYYFHMKMKILADFQFYISVPLSVS